jgi:excisionase family DNA binding protein
MTDVLRNEIEDKLDQIIGLLGQLVSKEHSDPHRLLRLKEAAGYISVSAWKLRGLIQKGEIAIVKNRDCAGGVWLIDVEDLDDWIIRSKATL